MQPRRNPGAGPARLPCSALKLLRLSHLWCKRCILRSTIPSSVIALPALRTNSLYRDSLSAKSVPDEETLFIRGLGTVRMSPLGACYPDRYNHLFGGTQKEHTRKPGGIIARAESLQMLNRLYGRQEARRYGSGRWHCADAPKCCVRWLYSEPGSWYTRAHDVTGAASPKHSPLEGHRDGRAFLGAGRRPAHRLNDPVPSQVIS